MEKYGLLHRAVIYISEDLNDWLARALSPEEVGELRMVRVQLSSQRMLDLANPLQAWKGHVEKIEGDLSLPESDRSLWGAHDFIAALYIRDFLQVGISGLKRVGHEKFDRIVEEIDERFRSYTEADEIGLAERADGRSGPNRGWWWRRIPDRGLIRIELSAYGRT
ncbi:MAG: hypothetical protein LBV34_03275 [Nocardiopsaceae bacterium]|nr:hypothetical protein [Nocardiopsaceae bacterium]